ncbi:amidohydrolase family protein [Sinanaerobacter chloroacetimidivorans]|uniref:Amidohydrolase n=1 Tax=Sinanaerobacter chloroacetimidivorans TaxID=2818044 RepID=A0A8J7VYK3_9FIRM|nr:amidohydrolase family protein [Sinanaerobacter chloroacetimidivorans]MBR0597462.1 amidohydrolase [Sinanaerobacter chloroacetimidivorans]
MEIIDIHAHFLPLKFIEKAKKGETFGAHLKTKPDNGEKYMIFDNGDYHPCDAVFFDMEARKKEMDEQHIDLQGISIGPRLLYYDAPLSLAKDVAEVSNDAIYEIVKNDSQRFFGVGTVPLQNTAAAIEELRKIRYEYGFRSIQIGTEINGSSIADPALFPFYEEVQKLGMTIIIHPFFYGPQKFLEDYYLVNFIGNPMYTTIAAAHLIFSGILEKLPELKFVLCHGGGFLPYQIARFDHGYIERSESKKNIDKLPSYYFKKNFYFDTILHDPVRTRALVDLVGADKVLLGTDYPYDMADHDPYGTVRNLNLPEEDYIKIVNGNARKLFLGE